MQSNAKYFQNIRSKNTVRDNCIDTNWGDDCIQTVLGQNALIQKLCLKLWKQIQYKQAEWTLTSHKDREYAVLYLV